jgi:WD40 repeat protein
MQVFDTRSRTEMTGPPESAIKGFYPLAYSPDGRWLATQHLEKIVVQNLQNPRLSFPLYGHKPNVVSGAFSQDGKLLATGSWDKTARVWDVAQQKLLLTLEGHLNPVRAVAFAPDRTTLATAGTDGIIRLWDITVGREVCTIDTGVSGLAALTFTPDGSELKAAFRDGKIRSWFAAPDKDIERWITEDQENRE